MVSVPAVALAMQSAPPLIVSVIVTTLTFRDPVAVQEPLNPVPSVIAGVDGPCLQLDRTLDHVRKLQATSVAELNGMLTRAGATVLPSWTPPATPACGRP